MRKLNIFFLPAIIMGGLLFLFNLYLCWESAEEKLAPYIGTKVTITGYVDYSTCTSNSDRCSFAIKVLELKQDKHVIPYAQRITINMEGELPRVHIIHLEGTLKELIHYRNPGGYDTKTRNWVQGIGGRIANPKLLATGGELTLLQKLDIYNYELRQSLAKSLVKLNLNEAFAPLLAGMVLGGSSQLTDEIRTVFIDNGLVHLLSVSGAHLVLLTGFATSILSLLFKLFPKYKNLIKPLLIVFMLLYALLCGCRAPIMRAVIMSIMLLFIGKDTAPSPKINKGYLLLFTALFLLCFKPLWLLDLGFQLSFGCTLGIIYLKPLLEAKLKSISYLDDSVKALLCVTMAAQLAILPLEIAYFHQLSLISLVSNIILVPVLELCMLLTLCGLYLSELFFYPAAFLLEQILTEAQLLANLPFSTIVIGYMPSWCILPYYALLFLLLDIPIFYSLTIKERRLVTLLLSTALCSTYWYEHLHAQPLRAYFLDVGQGDATLIRTPHGKLILVDTGGMKNYPTGSKIIVPTIKYLDKKNIDLMILTHWDYDHVGGAVSLAKQIRIDRLIYPDQFFTNSKDDQQSKELQDVILTLPNIKGKEKAVTGNRYTCDEINISMLHTGEGSLTGNAASTVISIDDKLLLMGDLPKEEEALLNVGKHDVLKLGHHGSNTSTGYELLDKVQPKMGIISCGRGNMYGHPHTAVLNRLESRACQAYRTDLEGCIKLILE